MIAKSQNWQKTAIAAAATALLTLTTSGAMALSLGRITVQSSLGEPLRAEIDVPDINAEEAASLKTAVALPEAFTAAGLEYNSALSGLQATLQRRSDGRAFIRLSSDRPINDPFVDMILEASWSSGRIVRDYTMLFDPPNLKKPAAPAATLPQMAAPVPVRPTAPSTSSPSAASDSGRPTTATRPAAPGMTPKATDVAGQSDKRVTVQAGDTATKIAVGNKDSSVSLDQMLVAMLRSNPDAFINNNIDRMRAGAVINVPSAEQAKGVAAPEATRILRAESKDFGSFRRSLATNAPATTVAPADRKTSGTIDSKVVDTKTKPATPDKLTLSKGSVQAKADEAKIAKERADKDAAARAAEIAKNTSDLNKALAATAAAKAAASAAKPVVTMPTASVAASAPAVAVAAITVPVAATPASAPASAVIADPVATAASAVASEPTMAASAPVEVASTPAKAPVVPMAPIPEPSFIDQLLDNPLIPALGVGLLALGGGFAFWRVRQNKKNAAQVDSSFLESRLQPDSFFGASGGQRVDTNSEGPVSGSSMVYSASQLDAADDVDPVAEADVYLAYGRDLQAEEILKEAARTNPGRLAIHTKLLEIFAKRRDNQSYEATAVQAYKLTGGESADWARICEMGLSFDPANTLYQPGGTPSQGGTSAFVTTAGNAAGYSATTVPQPAQPALAQGNGVDLDLDLDFSVDDAPASAISDVTGGTMAPQAVPAHEQTAKISATHGTELSALDFDMSGPIPVDSAAMPVVSMAMDSVQAELPTSPSMAAEFRSADTLAVAANTTGRDTLKEEGMLEFDMDSISLDLEPQSTSMGTASASLTGGLDTTGEDPLETKLALAEEFVSIGDEDGARALIEEVVAEATGDMRIKAQRALANLS